VLGDIRRELDEIVADERAGVERRLDEAATRGEAAEPGEAAASEAAADEDAQLRSMLRAAAARRLDQLDALPPDVGERIRGLQEYDFLEPARERFDALVNGPPQVLDQYVSGMSPGDPVDEPEDLAANRRWCATNELIRERFGSSDRTRPVPGNGSFRAPGPSTTSSTSWRSAWRPCSRSCGR
jgi:hypothetical protein